MSQTLTQRLRQARGAVQQRRWLAFLLHGGLGVTVLLLGFAALNRFRSMQEGSAFFLLTAAFAILLGWVAWISYRIWRRPLPLPDLAAEVEKKHPEWMDALICATEQEQKPEGKRRALEQALVSRMQQETAAVDFEAALIPPRWRKKPLLASLAALVLLGALLVASSFFAKSRYFLTDLIQGEKTGLVVAPGHGEAPVRTDVQVTAEVLRWEDEPQIEYIDETGRHRFPMHQETENHSFTFYDINDDIRYRILTPSLQTEWYRVTSYIPPTIDNTRIRVTPPAYTGLPEEEFDQFQNFSAVEGSQIEWHLTAPAAASVSLQTESSAIPLTADAAGAHSLTHPLGESIIGRFVMEDEAGRSARTPEFQIQAEPDLPPTIEVTQPGRDTETEPTEEVPLTALAADDFGLTGVTLHVSVSGQRQPPLELLANGTDRITERTIKSAIDFAALEAKEGDVVVYFFTATDNRQPEAQQTRSEVFFIEVREEVVPKEMEGQPMEIEQVDLNALIVELKRLVRLSWEAVAAKESRLEREIAAGLEEVRLETANVQQKIVEQIGEEAAAPIVAVMNRAMQRMETAGQLVNESLVDDSIPYQEMALADLVAIQTALEKNQTTSDQPSEGSSGQGPPPPETAQEESLEDLQRLMREVQKLSDDQATQNSALRRAGQNGLTSQQQTEFQRRQEEIRRQTAEVARDLEPLPATENALRDLAAASSSMENAETQLDRNQPTGASQAGDRARSSLLSALDSLENALGAATGNQVAQLAQQAQQLAQQQGQAAGGSRGLAQSDSPSPEEAAALRQQQEAMQQQLEELLASLNDTANQLRSENPEAAEAVAAAGQQIRDQGTAAEMGRAGNALLYRRYERAAEMQEAAAESLGEFAQSLDESAGLLPSMSREQLQQLLAQLQQAQREVMEMMGKSPDEIGEQLSQMASQMSQRVGRAGEALRNEALQELSGQLGATAQADQGPSIFRMNDMLRAAARSLEQQIFALEIERRARLQRQVSEPPERYRGLVEEYFKDLSETP